MPKKISVQNATCQRLLKKVLSTLRFSLNLAGKKEKFKSTNAVHVNTNGITLICSVCSPGK